jgi:hypothetical protein
MINLTNHTLIVNAPLSESDAEAIARVDPSAEEEELTENRLQIIRGKRPRFRLDAYGNIAGCAVRCV